MDADQTAICEFLKQSPEEFISRKEICRRAGGKWRFREDEYWAVPVLARMREQQIVESDETGHYRLVKETSNDSGNKQRVWMSPAIRSMLKSSGQSFGTIDLDKEPETAAPMGSGNSLLNSPASPEFSLNNVPAWTKG